MTMRCFVLLVFAATASAHDLWLIPPDKTAVGQPMIVEARNGMDFPISTNAPNVKSFLKAMAVDPIGGRTDLEAMEAEG